MLTMSADSKELLVETPPLKPKENLTKNSLGTREKISKISTLNVD